MRAQAKRLAALGVKPDLILHSPLARARQTAEIIAKALDREHHLRLEPRLSPGFNFALLTELLAEHAGLAELMLVGHAPDCNAAIEPLIGGGALKFGKGSVACIKVDLQGARPHGVLHWLATDDLLIAE
jgi:phosphohistidine phosphatase